MISGTIHSVHVVTVTETSIQTATTGSTDWFLWVPRNDSVTWFDDPIPGTLARVRLPDWLTNRHERIVLGRWSTSEDE